MKINILYEDSNILVIDKPAGVSVHPDAPQNKKDKKQEETITDWVLEHYPKMKTVGEPMGEGEDAIIRPGIVHRLDKDTSGVLILAKTKKAHAILKEQFQNREVRKVYHTVVSGWVRSERGVVNKPIGRSPNDFRKRLAGRGARGELREAITEYKIVKKFEDDNVKYTYLEVRPKTGRTHQIRVHMKYLNHPVVCDGLYNPGKPHPKAFTRLALHAKSITFQNIKGETVTVESPLPKEFMGIQ